MAKQLIRDLPYIAIGVTMLTIGILGNFLADLFYEVDDAT